VEEGIVCGGGVALVRCIAALDKVAASGEEKDGINLLKKAIGEPLKYIAINAGHEGSVVLRKVLEGKDDYGFNAETEAYENLVGAGVIDPTKVVRLALQNAASVAGLMITTEAMISEKPEKKKKAAMPAMDEDMY
jgi:chaperonin GroEL